MLHTDLIAPIPELLRRHAGGGAARSPIATRTASVTYAALLERTGKLAGHLADIGIAPGETVAILLPNSVAMGRDLPGDRTRRRDRRPDQLRCDRAGDRLPAGRCELPRDRHDRPSAAIWWRGCRPKRRTLRR